MLTLRREKLPRQGSETSFSGPKGSTLLSPGTSAISMLLETGHSQVEMVILEDSFKLCSLKSWLYHISNNTRTLYHVLFFFFLFWHQKAGICLSSSFTLSISLSPVPSLLLWHLGLCTLHLLSSKARLAPCTNRFLRVSLLPKFPIYSLRCNLHKA